MFFVKCALREASVKKSGNTELEALSSAGRARAEDVLVVYDEEPSDSGWPFLQRALHPLLPSKKCGCSCKKG